MRNFIYRLTEKKLLHSLEVWIPKGYYGIDYFSAPTESWNTTAARTKRSGQARRPRSVSVRVLLTWVILKSEFLKIPEFRHMDLPVQETQTRILPQLKHMEVHFLTNWYIYHIYHFCHLSINALKRLVNATGY